MQDICIFDNYVNKTHNKIEKELAMNYITVIGDIKDSKK